MVLASHLALAFTVTGWAPPVMTFERAMKEADLVGVVSIQRVVRERDVYYADDPPFIEAECLKMIKNVHGETTFEMEWAKPSVAWPYEEAKDVRIPLPTLGDQYMVYLKKIGNLYYGLSPWGDTWWPFGFTQPYRENAVTRGTWKGGAELYPEVSHVSEPVFLSLYRTRIADEPWEGEQTTDTGVDLTVVYVPEKEILRLRKEGEVVTRHEVFEPGTTEIQRTELTTYHKLDKPGEYWLMRGVQPRAFYRVVELHDAR